MSAMETTTTKTSYEFVAHPPTYHSSDSEDSEPNTAREVRQPAQRPFHPIRYTDAMTAVGRIGEPDVAHFDVKDDNKSDPTTAPFEVAVNRWMKKDSNGNEVRRIAGVTPKGRHFMFVITQGNIWTRVRLFFEKHPTNEREIWMLMRERFATLANAEKRINKLRIELESGRLPLDFPGLNSLSSDSDDSEPEVAREARLKAQRPFNPRRIGVGFKGAPTNVAAVGAVGTGMEPFEVAVNDWLKTENSGTEVSRILGQTPNGRRYMFLITSGTIWYRVRLFLEKEAGNETEVWMMLRERFATQANATKRMMEVKAELESGVYSVATNEPVDSHLFVPM